MKIREAATIKGALKHGEIVAIDQVPEIDVQIVEVVASTGIGTRGVGAPPARAVQSSMVTTPALASTPSAVSLSVSTPPSA